MDVDSLTDDEKELGAYLTTEENLFTAGTKTSFIFFSSLSKVSYFSMFWTVRVKKNFSG
jgi:hypothetical protein